MNALFSQTDRRRAFTLTELMVVIGVIAVLAGILLAAMGGVRRKALATRTQSTMTEFSKACDAFQLEQGRYPGALPESVIAGQGQSTLLISSAENALLDLMGGYRITGPGIAAPTDWNDFSPGTGGVVEKTLGGWTIRADVKRLGEGPVLFGKPYAPYFTPTESQVAAARGQTPDGSTVECCAQFGSPGCGACLPDLLDAWGQPIVFLRRARPSGPLVGKSVSAPGPSGVQPQFYSMGMRPYTTSPGLGELGKNQNEMSILNLAQDEEATLAQILRHPSLGSYGNAAAAQSGTAQGSYVLFSAGPDGIYFSKDDGPGTPEAPVEDFFNGGDYTNPAIIREYDDIRIFGGG